MKEPQWTLTPVEIMVMDMIVSGKNRKEIACDLMITDHTVKFHIANIFRKMGVRSIVAAALIYDRKKRIAA